MARKGSGGEEALDRLRRLQEGSTEDRRDGLMFAEDALPYRERVLWVCRCVRDAAGPNPDPLAMAFIEAVENCARNPAKKNKAALKEMPGGGGRSGALAAALYTAGWAAWEADEEEGVKVAHLAVLRAEGAIAEAVRGAQEEVKAQKVAQEALEAAEAEEHGAESAAEEARAIRARTWPVEWQAAAEAEAVRVAEAAKSVEAAKAALKSAVAKAERAEVKAEVDRAEVAARKRFIGYAIEMLKRNWQANESENSSRPGSTKPRRRGLRGVPSRRGLDGPSKGRPQVSPPFGGRDSGRAPR